MFGIAQGPGPPTNLDVVLLEKRMVLYKMALHCNGIDVWIFIRLPASRLHFANS